MNEQINIFVIIIFISPVLWKHKIMCNTVKKRKQPVKRKSNQVPIKNKIVTFEVNISVLTANLIDL